MSVLAGEQHPEAGAHHRLVVGDEHADRHARSPPSGSRVLSTKPPPFAAPARHLAAVDLDALADADEPVAEAVARSRRRRRRRAPRAAARRAVADGHVGVAGARVLERVRQALLHDPVGGEVDRPAAARPARPRRARARAGPRGRPRRRARRGRRGPAAGASSSVVAVAAHRAEQAAHLGERRAAGPLDAPQRLRVLGQLAGQLVADGADLEHHHADRVRDDVVQLARDPGALLGDRDAGRRVALPLGLRSRAPRPPRPARRARAARARQPADREQERDEDELAGRCGSGLLYDHDRRAADRDRQARPARGRRRAGCRAGTTAAIPATKTWSVNTTSAPSTNESVAADDPERRGRGERESAGGRAAAGRRAPSPAPRTTASSSARPASPA